MNLRRSVLNISNKCVSIADCCSAVGHMVDCRSFIDKEVGIQSTSVSTCCVLSQDTIAAYLRSSQLTMYQARAVSREMFAQIYEFS